VQEVYRSVPKPCVVFAIGACTNTRGIFSGGYNAPRPLDEVIREVDPKAIVVYIPGCPPKPEAMILGVAKALAAL
jgi:membrane-bound hydrogenase subunit mbhJ